MFHLTWGVCKHCSVAVLQGAGVRIWVWPQIIHGGTQLLECSPVVYELGLKSNTRITSKDNFQSTLDSTAAAQVNHPHNTSLTSILNGQNKTAGVMCSENVFTWYLTYARHWILMWNIGYCISHIHKGRIRCCSSLTTVISWTSLNTFCPGHHYWNVWLLQTAEQLLQLADPSTIFLEQCLRGHSYKRNAHTGWLIVRLNNKTRQRGKSVKLNDECITLTKILK